MQVYARTVFPFSLSGVGWLKCSFFITPNQQNQGRKRATAKVVGNSSITQAKTNSNHEHQSRSDQHWSRSIKRDTFWFQCHVVCLWGPWSRDEDDNERQKSHTETCVKNPQSCFGLIVLTELTWILKFRFDTSRRRSWRLNILPGRVTYWSQTLRSWKRWTHRKSTRKDSMRKRWYFPNKENLFFQSLMDESKPQEEIRNWEHAPWYGIDQFKERVTLTFWENQKGLFHNLMTHFRLPVKLWTIFGPCREASYTAITLNPESNFTRRKKNHSLFHWNTLTSPELLIRIWMSNKRSALMIIGILMALETCLIFESFTQFTFLGRETSRRICGPVRDWQDGSYIQARSFLARALEQNEKKTTEGETWMVRWKTETR